MPSRQSSPVQGDAKPGAPDVILVSNMGDAKPGAAPDAIYFLIILNQVVHLI